jgi:hypothetical protein
VGESTNGKRRAWQLKVSLRGVSKPPVWRRLLVPPGMRLDQLHFVIQTAMGWMDSHMHTFETTAGEYGVRDPELDVRDERRVRVRDVLSAAGERMAYTYDFGDNWAHDVVLEKIVETDPDGRLPVCVAGRGLCPPEDCGGPWGYADLREAIADPSHEEHEDMLEWLGLEDAADFDPAEFDLSLVNEMLDRMAVALG